MLKPPQTFDTPRLHLRPPTYPDAEQIYTKYAQDELVTKYLEWSPHPSIEVTQEFIGRCLAVRKDGNAFPWVIIRRRDSSLIGMVESRIKDDQADLGYVIARRDWGKGYATEAVQVVVDWAIEQSGISSVWAVCDVDNIASKRVLEKVGMKNEGILQGFLVHPNISPAPRDAWRFSITKDWKTDP